MHVSTKSGCILCTLLYSLFTVIMDLRRGNELSKEVISSIATLSKMLELDLQENDFIELLVVWQEELTNADLMDLEAQRKDTKTRKRSNNQRD